MSALINNCLKEISADLNQLQMIKKDYILKFDPESKKLIIKDMEEILQKIKEKVILIIPINSFF